MIVPHTDKVKRLLIPSWLQESPYTSFHFFIGSIILGSTKNSKLNLEKDYQEK